MEQFLAATEKIPAGCGLSFHHLGLAAREPERAAAFLELLGYRVGAPVTDPLQGVVLRLCTASTLPMVEIITPAATDGPLTAILAAREALFYHLCLATEDMDHSIAALRAAGQRLLLVSARKPAVLFGGNAVSFWQVRGFGLIEILETAGVAP